VSFGFDIKNDAGDLVFSETQTGTRLIHSETFAHDFSGAISVPKFDDAKGMFNVVFHLYMQHFGARIDPDDTSADPATGIRPHFSSHPTLHWDNNSKILTVTPETNIVFPGVLIPDFTVTFFHFS